MDIISRYSERYPSDTIVLIGGAACYWWIKCKLDIEIPLKDLDIHISTQSTEKDILDRLLRILPQYHIQDMTTDVPTLVSDIGMSYDIFINQEPDLKYDICNSIPVESIQSLISYHDNTIEAMEEDLLYIGDPLNSEYIYTQDKISRMKHRVALLKQLE